MVNLSHLAATSATYAAIGAAGGYVSGFVLPLMSVKALGLSALAGVTPLAMAKVCAIAGALIGGAVSLSGAKKTFIFW